MQFDHQLTTLDREKRERERDRKREREKQSPVTQCRDHKAYVIAKMNLLRICI